MTLRIGAVLVLGLALSLSACSSDGDGEEPAKPAPSATTGSDGVALPDGYPTDEVPLVDGEIDDVLENEALGAYLVKVYPGTDFPTAFNDATDLLEGAGFTKGRDVISTGPSSSTATFTSPDWEVLLTGGMPEKVMLQYTVTPR